MFKRQKLKKCRLFQNLTDDELKLVAEITEEIKLPKGNNLFYEGANNQDLYLIIDGIIEISMELGDNEKIQVTKMKDGGIVGDFAFIDEGVRSATASAIENCHLFVIKKSKFDILIQNNPRIGITIYKELGKEICKKIRERNKELKSAIIWESID